MQTLKQILDEEKQILDLVLASGGELGEEEEKALDQAMRSLCEKVDAYSAVMEGMEKRTEAFQKQAEIFLVAAKAVKNAHDRLKMHMKTLMEVTGKDQLEGDLVRFTLCSGKPTLIIEQDKLDKSYLMAVTEMVPDKKRIEEDLKLGIPVKGAFLKQNKTLRKGVIK